MLTLRIAVLVLLSAAASGLGNAGAAQSGASAGDLLARLQKLYDGIDREYRERPPSSRDLAHQIVGYGADDRALEELALNAARSAGLISVTTSLSFGVEKESHPAEFANLLIREAGPEWAMVLDDGTEISGRTLVAAEKQKPLYWASANAVTAELEALELTRKEAPAREAPDYLRLWDQHRRRLVEHQRRLVALELSWFIEAVARTHSSEGVKFASEWVDGAGHTVSLPLLLDSQIELYEKDLVTPEVPFVTERGVHILASMMLVMKVFAGDESFAPFSPRYREVVDSGLNQLLRREPLAARKSYAEYIVDSHLIEMIFDNGLAKPEGWSLESMDFCKPLGSSELLLLGVFGEIESRASSDRRPGYAFSMHALRGLRYLRSHLETHRVTCEAPRPGAPGQGGERR